jgi:outer membrane protein TolC
LGPLPNQYARVNLDQKVLDLSALHDAHAAQDGERVSLASLNDSRNIVVLATVSAYLQVAAGMSRVDVAKAEVASATNFYELMEDRVRREVSPDIDLIRAKVAMQTAEQALDLSEVALEKSKLSLARVIGLHVAQQFALTDAIHYHAPEDNSLDVLVQQAAEHRSDLQSAQERVKQAKEAVSSAAAERLPSLGIKAYYGGYGVNPGTFYGNYSVAGSLKVPIYAFCSGDPICKGHAVEFAGVSIGPRLGTGPPWRVRKMRSAEAREERSSREYRWHKDARYVLCDLLGKLPPRSHDDLVFLN